MYVVILCFSFKQSKYFSLGRLMAMRLSHEASGFPYLAPSAFRYLCKPETLSANLREEDIPDFDAITLVEKVRNKRWYNAI